MANWFLRREASSLSNFASLEIDELLKAPPGSPWGLGAHKLESLSILIEAYEVAHDLMGQADLIQAIKLRIKQQELSRKDLAP